MIQPYFHRIPRFSSACAGTILIFYIGNLFGLSQSAAAESVESPAVSDSKSGDPQLDELNFFVQDWQCQGSSPPSDTVSSFQWSMIRELNNLWFFARASSEEEGTFEVETLGYNTILGKFGRTIIGNDGKFANFLSEGWSNDQMVWAGRVSNMLTKRTGKHQITITKIGDRSFTEVEEVARADNQWQLISQRECVK
ncbi:MAG: hypothetical protein AAGB19_22310 [Cyanobacteria bacterium P01_F01_bin.3]